MIIKSFKISAIFLVVFIALNDKISAQSGKPNNITTSNKQIVSVLDYEKLKEVKKELHTFQYASLYRNLLKAADKALQDGAFSVMQKTQIPPSGTKHDYMSIGPYWWPEPIKADGLPWIRKDGEVNPLTRKSSTDFEVKNHMFSNTNTLAMAYFFSDKKEYALKALELLKVWFLNEDTRMNPNLNFAQAIPGKNLGRGIGIIEFAGITNIISAIEILEMNKVMDFQTDQELRHWFTDYLSWLQTSDNGISEKNTKNNHGTHYDVQVVSILLFLGRIEVAKQVLETVKTKRIAKQIEPNGEQPLELARTKGLSYSTMNLKGFTELAFLGKKLGIDLWNYEANNGGSIIKAYEFLKPYAKGDKIWDYKQIHNLEGGLEDLKELFTRAGSQFNIQEYCEIGVSKTKKATSLLYSCF